MGFGRRRMLTGSALAAAGAAIPLSQLFERRVHASVYGPLVRDPESVLALPEGFRYRILESQGQPMSDGYRVPARPDGMACFEGPNGQWVLMRNHEVSARDVGRSPYAPGQRPPPEAFDPEGMGGVTRVVVDPKGLKRVSSNLVLAGTVRNCAGGPSPFGWLSCEETVQAGHGYVFACSPSATGVEPARIIKGYGRFRHEAAAVDPGSRIAYLTEDRPNGALYRFVPHDPGAPFEGQLQAMRVTGEPRFNTAERLQVGDRLEVTFVPIDDPDPTDDSVRLQARSRGAAIVRRGEGAWWRDGCLYVCASTGGPAQLGQIFRYLPDSDEGGTLELLAQSGDRHSVRMPDNITVAPSGDVYMAEDSIWGGNGIQVLHVDGTIGAFARNMRSGGELAGVCFSPDGSVLFANLQNDGLTVAISGPFLR